jgi:hypothetical protein
MFAVWKGILITCFSYTVIIRPNPFITNDTYLFCNSLPDAFISVE